jgi:hypothetical protein
VDNSNTVLETLANGRASGKVLGQRLSPISWLMYNLEELTRISFNFENNN